MSTRSAVLVPVLRPMASAELRPPEARLEEAVALAEALQLEVVLPELVGVREPAAGTLFGSGQVERLAEALKNAEIKLAVVDHPLSPVQQRNLEKAWACKVIDRTGLILEIFGARAKTREGQLQVELAALNYQKSRLVRSWTHLERQRGGFGFLGGPGESQLELDRRIITDRIVKIEEELEKVRQSRALQREARKGAELFSVALVGYTNAGKSTLFNRLTEENVLAKDMLFATLDPTIRPIRLPSGVKVLVSDTVGFISGLPTQLVAAFHATLEEVQFSDIIMHVRDTSSAYSEAEREAVHQTLGSLGIDVHSDRRLVEVLNKADLLPDEELARLEGQARRSDSHTVLVSALNGQGIDKLLQLLDNKLHESHRVIELRVPSTAGEELAWVYRHGRVIERQDGEDEVLLRVAMSEASLGRYGTRYGGIGDGKDEA